MPEHSESNNTANEGTMKSRRKMSTFTNHLSWLQQDHFEAAVNGQFKGKKRPSFIPLLPRHPTAQPCKGL